LWQTAKHVQRDKYIQGAVTSLNNSGSDQWEGGRRGQGYKEMQKPKGGRPMEDRIENRICKVNEEKPGVTHRAKETRVGES
jgi:hypothetical protein